VNRSAANWDTASVNAEVSRIIRVVADSLGLPAMYLRNSTAREFGPPRRLAVVLCADVMGVDPAEITGLFKIFRSVRFRQTLYYFKRTDMPDPEFRVWAQGVCDQLGRPIPRSPQERQWTVETMNALWAAVAGRIDAQGDWLMRTIPKNATSYLTRWRYLAADLSLRLPRLSQDGFSAQVPGFCNGTHQLRRDNLPEMLRAAASLRLADREIASQFHLPFRLESREP